MKRTNAEMKEQSQSKKQLQSLNSQLQATILEVSKALNEVNLGDGNDLATITAISQLAAVQRRFPNQRKAFSSFVEHVLTPSAKALRSTDANLISTLHGMLGAVLFHDSHLNDYRFRVIAVLVMLMIYSSSFITARSSGPYSYHKQMFDILRTLLAQDDFSGAYLDFSIYVAK